MCLFSNSHKFKWKFFSIRHPHSHSQKAINRENQKELWGLADLHQLWWCDSSFCVIHSPPQKTLQCGWLLAVWQDYVTLMCTMICDTSSLAWKLSWIIIIIILRILTVNKSYTSTKFVIFISALMHHDRRKVARNVAFLISHRTSYSIKPTLSHKNSG